MSVWLKRQGVDMQDNRTWARNFDAQHFHMSESILGMMNDGPPCFSRWVGGLAGFILGWVGGGATDTPPTPTQ